MNDAQLSAFLAIAGAGSIRRAARDSFASQQSLTYQLGTLEDELGYELFERTPHGVRLTPAGELFRSDAELILRTMRDAVGRAAPRGRGREVLRVSLRSDAGTMLLAEVCERFMELYPEVDMRFVSLTTAEQFRDIRTGAFDVMECPDSPRVREPGIAFERVATSPNVCLVRRGDPLASRGSVSLADLEGRQVCIQDSDKCRSAAALREAIRAGHPGVELVNLGFDAAQITVASLSDVVVVAPRAFARHNVNPAVQVLVPLEGAAPVEIGLVHAGERPLPVVARFIEVARSMAAELG